MHNPSSGPAGQQYKVSNIQAAVRNGNLAMIIGQNNSDDNVKPSPHSAPHPQDAVYTPKNRNLLIITGPTAVGKTAVAIEVAKKLNTVILSADSRQCYRELNIGVARPGEEELAAVPHYFIASHSVHQKIDAAYYGRYALNLLNQLFQQHSIIVVTGGTGLYIKALAEGLDEIPEIPRAIRDAIIENYETNGINWLHEQLNQKDPLFSAKGEMQNPHRMMRALEVVEATGQSIMYFRTGEKASRDFNIAQVALEMNRAELYERINLRVDGMIAAGLEGEARELWPLRNLNALQTVGYKEMFEYFNGALSFEQAVEQIKQNTRRYAKRQMTWFKKRPEVNWVNLTGQSSTHEIATKVLQFVE